MIQCETVVARLHKLCCEPERSPRLAAIEDSLVAIRGDLGSGDPESLDRALSGVADIGEEIGRLQVHCCATARMPLYAEVLTLLNRIQLGITKELGLSH